MEVIRQMVIQSLVGSIKGIVTGFFAAMQVSHCGVRARVSSRNDTLLNSVLDCCEDISRSSPSRNLGYDT